jgi:hypothetical protein
VVISTPFRALWPSRLPAKATNRNAILSISMFLSRILGRHRAFILL